MSFATLATALAAKINQAPAAAPAEAERVTVELAVTADRRIAPRTRRATICGVPLGKF